MPNHAELRVDRAHLANCVTVRRYGINHRDVVVFADGFSASVRQRLRPYDNFHQSWPVISSLLD